MGYSFNSSARPARVCSTVNSRKRDSRSERAKCSLARMRLNCARTAFAETRRGMASFKLTRLYNQAGVYGVRAVSCGASMDAKSKRYFRIWCRVERFPGGQVQARGNKSDKKRLSATVEFERRTGDC